MSRIPVLVMAALLATGCVTRPVADHAIDVPAGLSLEDVERAMGSAVQGMGRSANPLGGAGREWSAENPAPGYFEAVMRRNAGFQMRYMVLRVAVQYSADEIWTRIIGGTNVRFDGERVHKRALDWQRRLDQRIEVELRRVADEKRGGEVR